MWIRLLLTLSALVLWAGSAMATVNWNDGFEYANDAALGAVWDESCLGNPGVSTDRARSGSKSLKLVYRGVAGKDPGAGGCFMSRYLPALSDTMWMRAWVFLDNFTPNSVGTKMIGFGSSGTYPGFWWEMSNGQRTFSNVVVGAAKVGGTSHTYIVNGGAIPQGQWACLEGRVTMNTPGVANGIIQSWVNGTAQINQTTQLLRWSSNIPMGGTATNGPNSQLIFFQLYVQHGVGTIYYDDIAVSGDARIGCSGSAPPPVDPPIPPPIVTRPAAPVLTAVVSPPTSITVTWPASAGVKTDLRWAVKGTGWGASTSAACTVSPCTIAGLLAGTTYELQAVNYTGTANVNAVFSPLSAVVSVTMPTAPVVPGPAASCLEVTAADTKKEVTIRAVPCAP